MPTLSRWATWAACTDLRWRSMPAQLRRLPPEASNGNPGNTCFSWQVFPLSKPMAGQIGDTKEGFGRLLTGAKETTYAI